MSLKRNAYNTFTSSLSIQRLANTKAHTSRFVTANLPCNKFKNRLVNIMPYETTRVCLQPIRGLEGSDYINASYIDGYRYVFVPKMLIWPDPLVLFWWLDGWVDRIGFHHAALTCHVLSDLSLLYTCSHRLSRYTALASVPSEGDWSASDDSGIQSGCTHMFWLFLFLPEAWPPFQSDAWQRKKQVDWREEVAS